MHFKEIVPNFVPKNEAYERTSDTTVFVRPPARIGSTKGTATLKNALEDYLMDGGFPELPYVRNKTGYIDGLVNTVVSKDIRLRYHIRNAEGIKTLANHLINNFALDFVVTHRGVVIELIQVSYDVDNPKTLNREIKALVDAAGKTSCKKLTLVTMDHTETIERGNFKINVLSALDWLLGRQ